MMNERAGSETSIRINKYLAMCGVCSRREADLLVKAGRVTIDDMPAEPGSRVSGEMRVAVDGQHIQQLAKYTYLMLYKPRGIVCTSSTQEPDNIISFLNYPKRLTYAGRLDKDSEGLMLMTDDGDLIHAVMRAGDLHEKEYEVTTAQRLRIEDLQQMERGVYLTDISRQTRPCRVQQTGSRTFRIVLTEGINREIRRLCKQFGYRVVRLKRIRLMNLNLGNLQSGAYRLLTAEEQRELLTRAGLFESRFS